MADQHSVAGNAQSIAELLRRVEALESPVAAFSITDDYEKKILLMAGLCSLNYTSVDEHLRTQANPAVKKHFAVKGNADKGYLWSPLGIFSLADTTDHTDPFAEEPLYWPFTWDKVERPPNYSLTRDAAITAASEFVRQIDMDAVLVANLARVSGELTRHRNQSSTALAE